MGYTGVPSRRPMTVRARTDGKGPPPRGLVIVVVVLVAAMVLMAAVSVRIYIDVSEEPPSRMKDGVLVVEGDVVWDGRTGTMDAPVEVRRGGSLTLRDCDLQVPLERLIVDDIPWFSGYPGSEMVVEASSVTIVADPFWNECLFLSLTRDYFYRDHPELALLWRAVDLRGCRNPVLTLDVNPMNRSGDLLVTVQPSPGEDMELLETVSFEGGGHAGWENLLVDLSAYTGEIVGLALGTANRSLDGLLFKQVRVTEDGADPPGDAFPTGDPTWDGWYHYGISSLEGRMRTSGFQDLFSIEGSLALANSTLSAPHLPRGDGGYVGEAAKMRLWDRGEGFNTMSLSKGGDVHVWEGDMAIADSSLENVTLQATMSRMTIEGSHFVADREQATLFRCWGSIEDSAFRFSNGTHADGYRGRLPRGPDLWSVSAWGEAFSSWATPISESLSITGCVFRDSVMGVDLARTRVLLEDCTFENISWIAVWDHEARGIGTWEDVETANEFRNCGHTLFFRTHDLDITYYHARKSFEQWDDYIWTEGEVVDSDGGNLPLRNLIWTWNAYAEMYMPNTIVNVTNGVVRPEWVEVLLEVEWAGSARERLPTDATEQVVDFTDRNSEGVPWIETQVVNPSFWPQFQGSPEIGKVEFWIEVVTVHGTSNLIPAPVNDMEVGVRRDGVLLRTVELVDEELQNYGSTGFNVTLDMPMGLHVFNFTLTGVLDGTRERTYIGGWNISVARADVNTSREALSGWLEAQLPALVLDPGTSYTMTAEDVPERVPDYYWYWEVSLGNGSVLALRDIPRERLDGVYLRANGPGGVVLDGLDLDRLDIGTVGGWARLSNVTTDLFRLRAYWSDLLMEDCSGVPDWWLLQRCVLTMERCRLDLSRDFKWTTTLSDMTFVECQLNASGDYFLQEVGNGHVRFIDTRFEDVNITFDIGESLWGELEVRGCELGGDAAFLRLSNYGSGTPGFSDEANISRVDVSGNTLNGPNGGISAEAWLFEEAISGNTLVDGARYELWYNLTPQIVFENESFDDYELDFVPVSEQDGASLGDIDWGYYDRKLHFLMETTDGDALPGPPDVRLRVEHWHDVLWFVRVDLADPSPVIHIPDWGDHTSRFLDLVTGWQGDDFWKD